MSAQDFSLIDGERAAQTAVIVSSVYSVSSLSPLESG